MFVLFVGAKSFFISTKILQNILLNVGKVSGFFCLFVLSDTQPQLFCIMTTLKGMLGSNIFHLQLDVINDPKMFFDVEEEYRYS